MQNNQRSTDILPGNASTSERRRSACELKSNEREARQNKDHGWAAHAPLLLLLVAALFFPFGALAQDEVQVNVLGKPGSAKFNQANITREENKVIQAVFSKVSVVNALINGPDGTVLIAGSLDGPAGGSIPAIAPGGSGGTAFVARISSDLRRMEKLLLLPPEFASAQCLDLAPDGSVVVGGEKVGGDLIIARLSTELDNSLWTKSVTGDRAVSVSVSPDNSVVVCPAEIPFVSRIAPDGSKLIPFGNKETFRSDAGNPDVFKAWWEDCGYVAAGFKGAIYHRGGCGGVRALKDGTFVLFTTNFVRLPNGQPDFDPMLLKFDAEGKVLWCTNLLDGLPAESDQKNAFFGMDRHNGDLLLAATQHGHFSKNLVFTANAFLNPHAWFTADIMIGWIARVDPGTGKPKVATYYFPELPGPAIAGKRKANSLFPKAPTADAEGNIYVTGATASKLSTTLHAFQPEPLGGSGFVTVFDKDLSRVIYASLITSKGFSLSGLAITLTPAGPAVIADFKTTGPGELVNANADVTNYLAPTPASPTGSIMGFYPSGPWKD